MTLIIIYVLVVLWGIYKNVFKSKDVDNDN